MIVDCKKQDNFHINRTTAVELYFKEIRKYPVLSPDEQRELLIKAKDGDMCARDKLVKCNQLFVASIAKKYQTDGNFLDIVNEGNIGLLIAIDKFDLSKGNGFLTYAVGWVRKKINEYNASVVKMVKTKNATKLYTYVRKIRNEFFVTNERYPTTDEIRDILRERYDVHVKDKSDLEVLEVRELVAETTIDGRVYRSLELQVIQVLVVLEIDITVVGGVVGLGALLVGIE
jgi:RNA polymerase sigma factor (sigma-70 family)